MTSTVHSSTPHGMLAQPIVIECDMTNGLPGIVIVGMGSKSIEESKERIKSALMNSKLELPRRRVTLNLAPAELRKEGTCLDMAAAIAILLHSGQLPSLSSELLAKTVFVGELSLSGELRVIRGCIGHVLAARAAGAEEIIIPADNAEQASLITGIAVRPAKTLIDVVQYLLGAAELPAISKALVAGENTQPKQAEFTDITTVQGQLIAKRGLEIAAAGGHNILLSGSPGTGKTMLARALQSILPPLTPEESIEITALHSLRSPTDTISTRPFRAPHHSASHIAIIGGGGSPLPGEVSLAHFGVLFLDEIAEFSRSVLESLRQPLEDNIVTIARAGQTMEYPANCLLVASQNPCPCGYYGDATRECICATAQIRNYQKRLSGPLLDRIDMHIQAQPVATRAVLPTAAGGQSENKRRSAAQKETLEQIRSRIKTAVTRQQQRFNSNTKRNASMTNTDIGAHVQLGPKSRKLLEQAGQQMKLSPRALLRCLRLARTIADLEDSDAVTHAHIAESLSYRQLSS